MLSSKSGARRSYVIGKDSTMETMDIYEIELNGKTLYAQHRDYKNLDEFVLVGGKRIWIKETYTCRVINDPIIHDEEWQKAKDWQLKERQLDKESEDKCPRHGIESKQNFQK